MKVFLTGATGYVGHELALALAQNDIKVHALVRDLKSSKIPKHKNISLFLGDIRDYDAIETAVRGCKYVFHAAAYTNLRDSNIEEFYQINVIGTHNVLKASYKNRVKRVVCTSTLAVFGPSLKDIAITENQPRLASYSNHYELTKSMSEEVVFEFVKKGLHCSILNVTKVFGPGVETFSGGVNRFIKKIMKSDILVVPSKLDVVSNYVFISDVVKAHMLALRYGESGEKYIVGGENLSYENLFVNIIRATNSKVKLIKINYRLIRTGLSAVNIIKRIVGGASGVTATVLDSLFVNRISSSQKAISRLHYRITPFNRGLQLTLRQFNK